MVKTTSIKLENKPTTKSSKKNDIMNDDKHPVENKVVETAEVSVAQKKVKKLKKESSDDVVVQSSVPPVKSSTSSGDKLVAPVTVEVPLPSSEVSVPTSISLADNSIVLLLGELATLDQQESLIQQQRRIKRRLLEKAIIKVLKANNKATTKKQKRSGNRQPSGFIRPTLISDELAIFLGKDIGSEMARTAVTNHINTYIKQNDLKDPKNGRQINADSKLSKLLKLGKEDVLTYFNLQKYMKHHFIKKSVDTVVEPVVV